MLRAIQPGCTASAAPDVVLTLAGAEFVFDRAGALYWPSRSLLAVSDLHLEKGSSFAAHGVLLPPYDTAATLVRLKALIVRFAPHLVVALGDNFHDSEGAERLDDADRAMLGCLQRGRDWIWITGNHDPAPARNIGGHFCDLLALDGLTFRHKPGEDVNGEIAGHMHPVARIRRRGRTVSRRCFACDGTRLVLPAFGAYAGGLNVRNQAFAKVFPALDFTVHLLGDRRVYPISARRCLPD